MSFNFTQDDTAGIADILDLTTTETDTSLRLAPDGVNGVTWAVGGGSSSAGGIEFNFAFDAVTTDSDPGAGKFRFDNATQGSISYIYVNNEAGNGVNLSTLFKRLDNDDRLYLQVAALPAKYHLIKITGRVINAGTYIKVPVSSESLGTAFGDTDKVGFVFGTVSETPSVQYLDYIAQVSTPTQETGREWSDGVAGSVWTDITGISFKKIGELPVRIFNNTGNTLFATKNVSSVDMVDDDIYSVELTDASNEASAHAYLGMVVADIADQGYGFAYKEGSIVGDTNSWSELDSLFVDPANPGDNTNIPPVHPNFTINTGTIQKVGIADGIIDVSVEVPISIDIQDVINSKMEWKNVWTTIEYQANEVVRDGDWTMVANKVTSERAAPQPNGEPDFALPDAPTWDATQSNTSVVVSGHTYEFTETGWIRKIRVWVPTLSATTHYRFILVDETNALVPIYRVIEEPLLLENEWTSIAIGNTLVTAGTKLRIVIDALNSSATTNITGGWTYAGKSSSSGPGSKECNRNSQQTIVRIHDTDLNSTDRTSELLSALPDSKIRIAQTSNVNNFYEYTVLELPIDKGDYIEYVVSLINSGGSEPALETATINIDIPIAQSTTYKEEVDRWVANQPSFATVSSLLEFDGVPQAGIEDNSYGVDIEFQHAYISPDWDLLAVSTTSTGGDSGGGGTGVTAAQVSVADAGGFYAGADAEAILDEIGQTRAINGYDLLDPDTLPDLSFVTGTRTFTASVQAAKPNFSFWVDSKKITKTTSQTVIIPDVTGTYYVVFDNSGTLQSIPQSSVVAVHFYENAITGLVYWNATDGTAILGDERHGILMDARTHHYNHSTFGARYESGLDITGLTNGGTTYTNTTSGYFWDEDIRHTISLLSTSPFIYRLGATGEWTGTTPDNKVSHTAGGSYHVWNEWTGSTWQLTEGGSSTDYWIIFYIATPDLSGYNVKKIIGHNAYKSANAARNAIDGERSTLSTEGLPNPEYIFLFATIVKRTGETQEIDSDGNLYLDLRTERGGGTGSQSTTASVAGNVVTNTANFNTHLSATDTDVQAALDTLDDHVHVASQVTDFAHSFMGAQHTDVDTSALTKNDIPIWNGSEWKHVPEGTTFTFSIATFTDDEPASIIEIGAAGTWKAIGAIDFSASYNNGPPSAAPTVQLSGQFAAWVSALDMTTGPGYTGPTASLEAIAYPSAPSSSYGYITLSATDGVDPDTHVNYFRFYNNRHWGVSSSTSLDESGVEGLAGKELSNSQVKTMALTLGGGEYGYYCIRAALPDPVFYIGGFLGGVSKLTSTLSITNPSGFVENYKVFRTDNPGLGSISLEARAS